MALKVSYPTLLLSFILLVAWLAPASGTSGSGKPVTSTNDQFLRRHWDNPKTQPKRNTYCNLMTCCRGVCKKNTTFIHETITAINSICTGKPNGLVRSARPFKITVCKFDPKTGKATEKPLSCYIVIQCKTKRPVRFVKRVRCRKSI